MSDQNEPKYSISVESLGPIMALEGVLSKRQHNLIFARNGTGKSFVSRAIRCLDLQAQGHALDGAPGHLVSDESATGTGQLELRHGTTSLGSVELAKSPEQTSVVHDDNVIFHVFNDDFVQSELRARSYEIDGDIQHEIAVDGDNIRQTEAEVVVENARTAVQTRLDALAQSLSAKKQSELVQKALVSKQLREYKSLELGDLLAEHSEKPSPTDRRFSEILGELDKLKSIPAEPVFPYAVNVPDAPSLDIDAFKESLERTTLPSNVVDSVKAKIEANRPFFETGIEIIRGRDRRDCPLCEQDITGGQAKAVIDAYIEYFADEEQKHRKQLKQFLVDLEADSAALKNVRANIARQVKAFNELKAFTSSQKAVVLNDCIDELDFADGVIESHQAAINKKAASLDTAMQMQGHSLSGALDKLRSKLAENDQRIARLTELINNASQERLRLQREACNNFSAQFVTDSWAQIEAIRSDHTKVVEAEQALEDIIRSSPSTNARDRVCETFEQLLRAFFEDRYLFDRDRFVLKRGEQYMDRGVSRTLSDGEKTAIAFCYFIACIHTKVRSNPDYAKVFLVFDDPVTSMSYDYVFSIAQTLKNLGVTAQGEVSINPAKLADSSARRPRLLVLTHSSYFFNVCYSNRVVKPEALFSLENRGATHQIARLDTYVAPFQQQLRDVHLVATGQKQPDHATGNAVRSVLEAVGRFCRPDKAKSLTDFANFLAGEGDPPIKSVLIQSMSHGTYYTESPSPADVVTACEEALAVVEHYAPGQLRELE